MIFIIYICSKCTGKDCFKTNNRLLKDVQHDDVIKWKHFPRNWPFVWGIHRSPVNSPHKGQWRGALTFSLICGWTNGWVNVRDAGDYRRHRAHYDVIVMKRRPSTPTYFSMSLSFCGKGHHTWTTLIGDSLQFNVTLSCYEDIKDDRNKLLIIEIAMEIDILGAWIHKAVRRIATKARKNSRPSAFCL